MSFKVCSVTSVCSFDAAKFGPGVSVIMKLRKSSGMKVSSDLRHHIAAVFNREGINIPFPQRDIHIIESKANDVDPSMGGQETTDNKK